MIHPTVRDTWWRHWTNATRGTWSLKYVTTPQDKVIVPEIGACVRQEDALFIITAREAVPMLLREVENLENALREAQRPWWLRWLGR